MPSNTYSDSFTIPQKFNELSGDKEEHTISAFKFKSDNELVPTIKYFFSALFSLKPFPCFPCCRFGGFVCKFQDYILLLTILLV